MAHARLLRLVAVVALLASAGGCSRDLSETQCRAVLDRYVHMSAGADPSVAAREGEAREEMEAELVQAKQDEPVYAAATARCRHELTASQFDCAMKAPSPNEWEACVQ